jgi:hypothetical protein
VKFSRALPCDLCDEAACVQIITVAFDGPSPADQLLCPAHAPAAAVSAPGQKDAIASS